MTNQDKARECAEEIVDLFGLNCKLGEHGPRHNIMVDEVETIKNILAGRCSVRHIKSLMPKILAYLTYAICV